MEKPRLSSGAERRRIPFGVKIMALLSSPLALAIAIALFEHVLGNLKQRYRRDPRDLDYFDQY